MTGTPAYRHVVLVMDENVGYSMLTKSPQAPYLHQLAAQCGSETFMHAATHPSQVNYMAATSGLPTGVGVHTSNDNIFHQAADHGDTWRAYEESMPKPCVGNSGFYKAGRNPPFWYDDLKSPPACASSTTSRPRRRWTTTSPPTACPPWPGSPRTPATTCTA